MEPAGWCNDGCTSLAGDADLSGQNNTSNNFTNNAWNMTNNNYDTNININNNNNIWDISTNIMSTTTCYDDWTNQAAATNVPATTSVVHAFLLESNTSNLSDPHMMCLKLGKRHYCDNKVVVPRTYVAAESSSAAKKCRPLYSCHVTAIARCQVEGCHVALDNVKEYYRKHKVCEGHSKAPKVVILGIQQRFCQQCSRFHGVTEFDEAKRSCRRRLQGHNQRRRKQQPLQGTHSMTEQLPLEGLLSTTTWSTPPEYLKKQGYAARSLLSSPKIEPSSWISSGDLSSRCSDALYELIVANRVATVARQFLSHHQNTSHQALDFGLLSMKGKSKESEEWAEYIS